jgi:hypothetical protein
MAKDEFGNYQAGLEDAGETLPSTSGGTQQVFGSEDGDVIGGVPQVTPTTETAIYVGADGRQYQYYGAQWH